MGGQKRLKKFFFTFLNSSSTVNDLNSHEDAYVKINNQIYENDLPPDFKPGSKTGKNGEKRKVVRKKLKGSSTLSPASSIPANTTPVPPGNISFVFHKT